MIMNLKMKVNLWTQQQLPPLQWIWSLNQQETSKEVIRLKLIVIVKDQFHKRVDHSLEDFSKNLNSKTQLPT